ncbi:SDR family NAD(P)-dependent oxidoreductase [Bacillus songklensis]|uniref:SDR family NAD(P)-dependent oxidoreductase n=1 Tax=Bacillus songklensis TaxID=1069116 RepID=A0ABV8B6H8_9BACI
MRKALVVGASGGMGYSIVKELSGRGIAVIAFARTKAKLEKLFEGDPNVTIFTGDIFRIEDLRAAASDVDVIFQAANIPYSEWEEKLALFMSNIVNVSRHQSAKLAIVDNIYAYGRSAGKKVSETTPKNPHTKKGSIRLQVETMVKESGVPALIVHFPDFYGPNAENTLLHYTLQNIVNNKKSSFVGDQKIAREFIFTPDGAKAIVNLALHDHAYGQNWNIPGYDVITGEEIVETIRTITHYNKRVSTVTKNMIRFLGLFSSNMREVVEMFYLNEEPVVLSGEKYEKLMGPLPRTSYREGLRQTIEYMKGNKSV